MAKIYQSFGSVAALLLASISTLIPCLESKAQSTILGSSVVNGTYTSYNLTDLGRFRQVRLQASSNGTAGNRTWEFGTGTAGSPSLLTNWRPVSGTGSQIQIPGYNQFIAPAAGSPPAYGSATANTSSGGSIGTLPAVSSGSYYTFNITENSAPGTPVNENMAVLSTSYNPVSITASSHSPSVPTPGNSVLVSVSTSSAPSAGEFLYIRYSTNINFTTSAISQVTMSGSSGTALIPCHSAGTTVYYYIFSSPRTSAQLSSDASTNGQSAYDMATLQIRNNGGSNFSFTVASGSAFSGVYSVPSTCYPTVASFVNALNTGTITGPVTLYVNRGHSETAPSTGIYLTNTGTASAPIRFLAYGTGAKPIIFAPIGTNSLSTGSAILDFIWGINGSDYVTIDGFDLIDQNASGTAQMEAGILVFRRSNQDASQNVAIRNCRISFAAPQNASGPGLFENGNKGIAFVPAANGALTTTLTIISPAGRCQNDTLESDTIINAYTGILFRGAIDNTIPYSYIDQNIVIGGNSASRGCVVIGFGENGIRTYNINNAVVSFNRVDNNNQAGYSFITTGFNMCGINLSGQGTNNANLTCTNNTITVRNNVVTSAFVFGIRSVTENNGLGTVVINDNTITNCYNLQSGLTGINVTQSARQVTVLRNTITRSRCAFTSGTFTGIQWGNSTGYIEKARFRENIINRDTTAWVFNGINGTSSTGYQKGFEVSRNTIGSMNVTDGILFTNIGTTSQGILNSISNPDYNVDSNIVAGIRMLNGTGTFNAIYDFGSPTGGLHTMRGNTIANITGTTGNVSQTFEGIRHASSSSNNAWVNNNVVRNINGFTTLRGIYTGFNDYLEIAGNTVDSLYTNPQSSSGTTCIGIDYSLSGGDSTIIRNNIITRIGVNSTATTSTSTATALNVGLGGTVLVSNNRISDIQNLTSSSFGSARGMALASATRIFAWNNAIANVTAPSLTVTTPAAVGIEIVSSGVAAAPSRLFNNTVFLNASGSSTNFSSTALLMGSSGTWEVFNNIFNNTSIPGSATTAFTAGIWKSTSTLPATLYTLASNNNLYFLNNSINRKYLVYRNSGDGSQDSTMCQFTTRLNGTGGSTQTREASSVQGPVTFLSTNRTSSNFLVVDQTVNTLAESGGKPSPELVNDFLGAARSPITPDIGADEFNGSSGSFSTATVNTIVTHPSTAAIINGSRDVQILRAGIRLSSLSGTAPANISRAVFNTNGTTNPTSNIDTAKLWYTSANNSFANAVLLGSVVNPNGAFAFSNLNQRIPCADTVYFWITYGVRCSGNTGDVIDCQLDSVYVSGTGVAASSGAPTGTRTITVQTGMSGLYTVGGTTPNYGTLNAAIVDLNTRGLTGPVTFEVRNGHIEIAPAGGIVINVNPTGCGVTRTSRTYPLRIQRASGTGAMPIIAAGAGTTLISSGTSVDGILKILGDDYITIDGLAFRDTSLNLTTTTKAEWGIALLKRNQDDGCKRIVIRNCVIRLDRANMNASTGNIRVGNGCVGINVSNITNASTTSSTMIPRVARATHDSILIENNTIVNCFQPINWYGPEFIPYAWKDRFDTIRNNTIFNWGGGTIEANGISMMNVDNYVIRNNNIQNKAGSGVDHTGTSGTFFGIRIGASTSPTSVIENFSSGDITGNIISLNHAPASSVGLVHGGIGIYSGGRSRNINVSDNKIVNHTYSSNSAGTFYGIYNTAVFNSGIYRRNKIDNINFAAVKTFYGIYNDRYSRYREMTFDTVSNIYNTGANGSTTYGLFTSYSSTTAIPVLLDSASVFSDNFIYKINYTPTSPSGYTFGGIYNIQQPFVNVNMQNNTVKNVRGLDFPNGLYMQNGNVVRMTGNVVDSIYTNSGYSSTTFYGIFNSGSDSIIMGSNSLTRLYANGTSTSTLYGILTQTSGFSDVFKNKIGDLNASGTSTTTVVGLQSNSSFNAQIYNNMIGEIKAPAFVLNTGLANPLCGILAAGTALHRIYNNTVYLDARSSATNFASAALHLPTTTGIYDIRNNILYNISIPSGTLGYTAALTKGGAGLPTTQYLATSNNNFLYSGTPSSTNVIYRNLTDQVSDIFICDFLNRSVSQGNRVRDAFTLTGTLSWASTTATANDFMHISTSSSTLVESAGQSIPLITDDFDGDSRGSSPDIGADEGSFTAPSSSLSIRTNVTQVTGGVSQGARNVAILRADVIVSGSTTTPSLTSLRFNTSGTTNPANNLDSAKVFFTGTSMAFNSNAPRFGSSILNPSGSLSFTGTQPLYCNDTFFFWLVYDVKCGSSGDSIDATANDIIVNGTTYSLSPSNPAGKRGISAAMSGTFTVGGSTPDYSTLAAALNDINLRGLSGPITLNVRANHTEQAPAGGLQLGINSSCLRANRNRPITIQKSGSGNNPIIFGQVGTGLNSTPTPDGIFKIIGEDWVTINGIDLEDSSTSLSNTVLMEWGYALLNSSPADGCKRVVITNSTIRLSKNQRETGSLAVGTSGSKGIVMSTILPNDITPLTLTSTLGSHDSCLFSNLTIQRCQSGITIAGFNDLNAPFALLNQRDSIVNCRITNFGTTDAITPQGCHGIRIWETNNAFIRGNIVDNRADGGIANNAQVLGIAVNPTFANNNVSTRIQNNVVRLGHTAGIGGVVVAGIYSACGGGLSRVEITDNKVWRSTGTVSALATWYGIWTASRPGFLLVERDTVTNDSFLSTMYGIFVTSAGSGTIRNNSVQQEYSPNTISHFWIYHGGSSDTIRITGNRIGNTRYLANPTVYGIFSSTAINGIYTDNLVENINTQTGGTGWGYNMSTHTNLTMTGNTFRNAYFNGAGSVVYGVQNAYSGGLNYTVRGNTFENLRSVSNIYGIWGAGVTNVGRVSNNTIRRLYSENSTNTSNYFIYMPNSISNEYYVDSNLIVGDTIINGGINGGIYVNTSTANSVFIRSNVIRNCLVNGNGASYTNYGILATGTLNRLLDVRNNLFDNDSFNTASTIEHFRLSTALNTGTLNVVGNRIINNRVAGTWTGFNSASAGRFMNINFNSVRNSSFSNMLYGVFMNSSQRYRQIIGDTFSNLTWRAGSVGTGYGVFYQSAATTDTLMRLEGNVFSNLNMGSTTMSYYGAWSGSSANIAMTERWSRNRFSHIRLLGATSGTGIIYGLFNNNGLTSAAPNKFIDSNTFHNLNTQGTGLVTAIYANFNTGNGSFIRNNNIDSLVGGNTVTGIEMQSTGNRNYTVSRNKISDLVIHGTAGASPAIYGVRYAQSTGGGKLFLSNNTIGGLLCPSNSILTLRGISIDNGASTDSLFMDHNTVFLNASTGGVNLAATGLFSATAPLTTMRNNLIVNQSTAKGTGRAIAFQRSSTITTSYLNRSNGNSFFAGTPGASNLIYADGTNSLQTLAAYRTFIGTNKDSIAVSVNPVFQSTSFGTDSFLRLTVLNTANCQLNKGGVPVNYVTTDYWNAARNNRQPDIGAHEFLPIPVITQQPVSVDICPGANTSFSVSNTAAGSSTYQWFRNGSALTNGGAISGATTASLTVTGATTADTGIYVLRTWLCQGDTAVSANARLRLNTLSLDPTSITASPKDTICIGKTATLQVNGGSLGTGATWRWYSGSCSGTSIGSGTSISVSPAVATTYFARAEGTCNNTSCSTITINLLDTSLPATSITGTSTICRGQSTTLSVNGGTLGTNASWRWYSGSCGATPVSTGSSVSVNPTTTTTYFVRAEGPCGNTICRSLTVTVQDTSVPATAITAGLDTLMPGQNTKLYKVGGSLGTSAGWRWYLNGCGLGSSLGSTDSISITPSGQSTYYLRAEGLCNNTICISKTIFVRDSSRRPTGIAASTSDTLCRGRSTTLTPSGGSLGFKATWRWYTSSCGGTLISSGNSLTVNPTTTTTYWVRAEGITNTTLCAVKTIVVRDTSVPATSVSASSDSICLGVNVTLSANGGTLGHNANWRWYSGTCGGTLVGSGTSIVVTPSATTTYFLRAEGTCNNTVCVSKTIKVNSSSTAPTAATISSSTVCRGGSVSLGITGGSLGSNAVWRWYSGSCGGTSIGTGTSLSVTPAASTTYFVRAEGTCNSTICRSVSVTVRDTSAPATTISGTNIICRGQSTTLSAVGGSLGTGASWRWYSGSCGGTSVGTGSSVTLSPTANTTYFLRAEGTCNNTICQSITITVRDTSLPATSITGTSTICLGQSTTLSVSGGNLGNGAAWRWYSGSCGGTSIGTGASVSVSPNATSVYFVRAEGTCNNTACQNITVTVRDTSVPAVAIAGNAMLCRGQSTTLSAVGGSLGAGASWRWYSGSCGGTSVGTGSSVTLSPTATTTYFLRAEGTCNNTICQSITVTVRDTSVPASSITGTSVICRGQSTTLSVSGGSLGLGAGWRWYSGSCGGTSIGTGASLALSPATTTTYFVRAEGICNNTICQSITVTVRDTSAPMAAIVGNTTICRGSSTTLVALGGNLGTGAGWNWYSGSCGGTAAGTGTTLTVSPAVTTTYFIRAEGTCNNTICRSVTVTVNDTSSPALSISGTNTICVGQTATLNRVGGSLGTAANWKWYEGSCGGILAGTGNAISVRPAVTTTYYLRAEGLCNTTICRSYTITVRDSSVPALSVFSSTTTICKGEAASMYVFGGRLGEGADWKWYTASCGGTPVGSGLSLTHSPSVTTTYFVRAEGICNNTICRTITINVNDTSEQAISITGNTSICRGQTTTLSVNGGLLGSGAKWKWYREFCEGIPAGIGSSITVKPSDTTWYYVRAEGTCNSTECVRIRVDVTQPAAQPVIVANYDTVCSGTMIKLSIVPQVLGSTDFINWYKIDGGNQVLIGTGASVNASSSSNLSVFARISNTCFNTDSRIKTITVLNLPAGTWVGIKNDDWNEPDNWCGGVPAATTDVVIPAGTKYQPVIFSAGDARNLNINAKASVTTTTSGVLNLYGNLSKAGGFNGNGTLRLLSSTDADLDGISTRQLEVNTAGAVTMKGNSVITGKLTLVQGQMITGKDTLFVTNDTAGSIAADALNPNYTKSWINGYLARNIKTVDDVYHMPVGDSLSGHVADFLNHNIDGPGLVVANFGKKPGDDLGILANDFGTWYGSVNNGGVWYIAANDTVKSGNFDLRLWFHNRVIFTGGMNDNQFTILRRPLNSAAGKDWTIPPVSSSYVVGTVNDGFARRNAIRSFGQFGLGMSNYGVKISKVNASANIALAPNPFNENLRIQYELNTAQNLVIRMRDMAGRLVYEKNLGAASGSNTVLLNTGQLSEGTYTVEISGDNQILYTSKLIKANP